MAVSDALSDALGYQRGIATSLRPVRAGRRLTMQRYPGVVEFILKRPLLCWQNAVLLLPALAAAAVFEYMLEGARLNIRAAFLADRYWLAGRTAAFVLFAWANLAGGLNSLSRRKILSVMQGQLILIERSMVRPVNRRWGLGYAKHFDVRQTDKRHASLTMTMLDGSEIEVLTDEKLSDLAWIRDRLGELLQAEATQGIKLETAEPPREITTIRMDGVAGSTPADTPAPPHPGTAP